MRLSHFEALKPICPRCNTEHRHIAPLAISQIAQQVDDVLIDASLICTNDQCRLEYPVIDGVPIIVNQLRKYLNDNFYHITARNDLPELTESILGDAAGPGAAFNSIRHYLSSYVWDHYGDKCPGKPPEGPLHNQQQPFQPGNVVNCLNQGLSLFGEIPDTPALDIGCAAGRSSFEIATQCNGLTLGVDLNFSLLRIAQQVLRKGRISFPLKRTGVVYDRYTFDTAMENSHKVDFWACDGSALPFNSHTFQFVSALNVLDAVNKPMMLLQSIDNVLATGGNTLLTTPYDWSPPVPMNNWLGGHSQRSNESGSSEQILRQILSSVGDRSADLQLSMVGEIEHYPWHVRVHSRRTVLYDTHIIACRKF